MKNLVELKKEELREVEGGWWPVVLGYLLFEGATNPEAHIDALTSGFSAGANYFEL